MYVYMNVYVCKYDFRSIYNNDIIVIILLSYFIYLILIY